MIETLEQRLVHEALARLLREIEDGLKPSDQSLYDAVRSVVLAPIP